MTHAQIPVSSRQVVLIGLLVAAPVLISAALIFRDHARAGPWPPGAEILALSALLPVIVCGFMLARRSVVVVGNVLTVRSAFYTLSIARDQMASPALAQVASRSALGITLKRNGIAGFGFLSGWFYAMRGEKMFCAVSTYPACHLIFRGHPKCSSAAISHTEAVANVIQAWIDMPGRP